MSSGTRSDPEAVRKAAPHLASRALRGDGKGGGAMALTERQIVLNRYWSFYRCQNYEGRRVDWDGRENYGPAEHDQIASRGAIPPGFYDAGQTFPLKFRKPTAPYYLARVIVQRFTAKLFGAKRHPKFAVDGDPDTEDYLNALADVGRLWQTMIRARNNGGAVGTTVVGFVFKDGKPKFEVHDARWCEPEFVDPDHHELESIEKRYAYPQPGRNPRTGKMEDRWFWYRRLIDEQTDRVWAKVPIPEPDDPDADEEPDWDNLPHEVGEHGLGFCPVVWIQNENVDEDADGDPDCHGIYDLIEAIDALVSQANRGVLSNCDPTLHIGTNDEDLEEIRKGSDNTVKTEVGGSLEYVEISGTGPEKAMELSEKLETKALRIARCVLESASPSAPRTATEIEYEQGPMLERCDTFREQYGERGVKVLGQMLLKAARKYGTRRVEQGPDGMTRIVAQAIALPKRVITVNGVKSFVDRKLGPGDTVDLKWPPYVTPTLEDIKAAGEAVGEPMDKGLLDRENAARFIAPYFDIEDTGEMLRRAGEEAAVKAAAEAAKTAPPGEARPGRPAAEGGFRGPQAMAS